MKHYLKYFIKLLKHKKEIFKFAWKDGLYVYAFTHDLSKFLPSEFIPNARYFYLDKDLYAPEYKDSRDLHYCRNKHHWQYWIDSNLLLRKCIPEKHLYCIINNWSFEALSNEETVQEFYLKNYNKMRINRISRIDIEYLLGFTEVRNRQYNYTLKEMTSIYDEDLFKSYFSYIYNTYKDLNVYRLVQ